MQAIKNALISVSNKTNIEKFAEELCKLNITIYSTGGTFKKLVENQIVVKEVSELTNFSEMMNGRVKTLHPNIYGGILFQRNNDFHVQEVEKNKIIPIDIVVSNLYPFEEVTRKECSFAEAIENIDIGGPSMIRAAAKNFASVIVISDPKEYSNIVKELQETKDISIDNRKRLAVKAFEMTRKYDEYIANYLKNEPLEKEEKVLKFAKKIELRYGENPHQKAFFYQHKRENEAFILEKNILNGKELSYNNYLDIDKAISVISEISDLSHSASACVIKHGNPCGIATGKDVKNAIKFAWEGDIVSSFGSIVALNEEVSCEVAHFFADKFIEIIIAPSFAKEALNLLKKKKNLRIIEIPIKDLSCFKDYRMINGGLLQQEKDGILCKDFVNVTNKKVKEESKKLFLFSYNCVKHIKSNAIAIGYEYESNYFMLMGAGMGQPNRVDAIRKLALPKAIENIKRLYPQESKEVILAKCVLASDAFFPFKDNIEYCHQENILQIIQPGGSLRDQEVIKRCNDFNIAMIFTNTRHFLH